MRLKTRVQVIILASLICLATMALYGLHAMRQGLYEDRKAQIVHQLKFADALIKHFHALEASGTLTREEAQARVLEALGAQKYDNRYFFIRNLTNDYFVLHPNASKLGKPDDGGKVPDGRSAAQAYREELANSTDNRAFLFLPGQKSNNTQAKLNGVVKFEPWGWMPGIGFYIDDIEARFWNQALYFLIVGSVLILLLAMLVFRMRGSILRQLGGEPDEAAENMRKIASGDLAVNIRLVEGDDSSMMASLKLMQMKLTNITSSIQDNAVTLAAQVKYFEDASRAYAESKLEEHLSALTKASANIGKTADILNRSIARFRL